MKSYCDGELQKVVPKPEHKKCDVYSFSMILYEMMAKFKVWSFGGIEELGKEKVMQSVINGKRPQIPEEMNNQFGETKLFEIMKMCWSQDPSERPDFVSVYESL